MSSTSQLPPASTRQHNFEQAVAYALHLWPALTLSVANGWGGPESAEKRDWFAGAIVELFPEFTDTPAPTTSTTTTTQTRTTTAADEADTEDVETVLLQVMVDEFEVNVDDDSALEVAQQIVRARAQCAAGMFDETNALAERFARLKGGDRAAVGQMFKQGEDPNQDTDDEPDDDSDDEDEDGDVDMGEASAPAAAPKQKAEPQVDEDGFTMVTKKR
ncbi:Pre-rRNA-processing protein TSR2 [Cordyceps fumosorosea ARSEF 2679]|uniref:Pre-rRNA-processing protein TSR2 n=1 Tax=Cordyceps fumosorosea (strain ARSEF 2679) TaxID=1081104 RepID=A0A162LGE7_CORFA|nr:Pre-rRNA-processing protein TSR2 [Cordyceps fumosorosea ARSEF 2679]OAA70244.1 Pre-rRNA-processing protein TSR2 [Cordyceps fumosorosea ARSEF 2679]